MPNSALINALSSRGLIVAASVGVLSSGSTSAEAAEGAAPDWIEVMPAGTFMGVDGRGPWTLKDAAAVVSASSEAGRPVPVDYNHQTVFAVINGSASPAAAWIDRFEVREGAIWAHVDWTADGAHAVASKAYRFISPTFRHDTKTGEIQKIVSVALVNNPNIAELPAIASQTGDTMDELLQALRTALGLSNDADQAAILAACRSSATETASALQPLAVELGLAGNASVADIAASARTKLATGTPDPAKFVPMAAFAELQGQVAELRGTAAQDKATTAVNAAMQAGKVTPALKDWALSYAAKDPVGFDGWVANAPAVVKPGGSTMTGAPPAADAASLDEAGVAVCAALGISHEAFKKETAQ